jgi:hypothetical protein
MQITSASLSLSTSYQLALQSASVSATTTSAPMAGTASVPADAAPQDSYLTSGQSAPMGSRHLNRWLARLEQKLEQGDVTGAKAQVERILSRIVQQLEKSGNSALRQVTSNDETDAKGATASGSAVQFQDDAKAALSLSFQTADGQQFSIEAAIDVSRTLARQQVSVPKAG